MKQNIFRGMIALFILSLLLLFFAPKILQWILVLVSIIPLLILIGGVVILIWYTFTEDSTQVNQKQ